MFQPKAYITLLLLLMFNFSFGQEKLISIDYNYPEVIHKKTNKTEKAIIELPFFDDFSKNFGSPNQDLWIGNDVYINNTYSNNPFDMGVATFDAIDNFGQMHSDSYGEVFMADSLVSQPINLNYPGDNSVYLSFYYQAQGNGDMPEEDDILELSFFAPEENKWNVVWTASSNNSSKLETVVLEISDEKYLKSGFQFKFQNYASTPSNINYMSLFSNCDHWNIDYVYLDRNRSNNDTIYDGDVAIVKAKARIFNEYSAVPWKHFTEETEGSATINPLEFNLVYRNHGYMFPNVIRRFEVNDLLHNAAPYTFTGGADTINSFETIDYTRNFLYDFDFDDTMDSAKYLFTSYLVTEADPANQYLRWNDTIHLEQKFYNYYAYDDGSAEAGYGIFNYKSGRVAYKFNSLKKDSLRAVRIFFNRAQNEANQQYFLLKVWENDNGYPGDEILSQQNVKPEFNDELNAYIEYPLDSVISLYGDFFIGWQQTTHDFLNVGFDLNFENHDTVYSGDNYRVHNRNLFVDINGYWEKSHTDRPGALMIQPVFEKIKVISGINEPVQSNVEFDLYPNPASDLIHLNIQSENYLNHYELNLNIYSLSGTLIRSSKYEEQINVQDFQNGFYILQVTDQKNLNIFKKFIINK